MKIFTFLKTWFISYIFFFVIDMFTHIILLSPIMTKALEGVIKSANDTIMPVIFFQTIVISMSTVFILMLAKVQSKTLKETASMGAAIGLLIYGIHEMNNFATIPGWSSTVTILHTLAGVIQMAIVSLIIRAVIKKISPQDL